MRIITVDGKEWDVKYRQNQEQITNEFGTVSINYPDFVGSKLYQNSSSSDKYSLNFSVHITKLVSFKESIKKFITDDADAINHYIYGKLTHLIIEHDIFGAIKGSIVGALNYNTSSGADVMCNCTFQEHTEDNPVEKRDIEIENINATDAIDLETTANFKVNLSALDMSTISNFADKLEDLYKNIQNSAVVTAFNDFRTAISNALLDSQKVMNSIKNIISLPNQLLSMNLANRLNLFKQQAEAIKTVPVSSYNMALFNINSLSYNFGMTSKTAFVSQSALNAAAGIKTVPLA